LADRAALRADISVDQATDIIFGLLSLELYLLFTVTRGWSPQRWVAWTITTLIAVLLTDCSG
jgi:hypothetical protein